MNQYRQWPELVQTLVPYDFMSPRKRKELSLAAPEPCHAMPCHAPGSSVLRMEKSSRPNVSPFNIVDASTYGAHLLQIRYPTAATESYKRVVRLGAEAARDCATQRGRCWTELACMWRAGIPDSSGCASSEPEEGLVDDDLGLLGLPSAYLPSRLYAQSPPGQPHYLWMTR